MGSYTALSKGPFPPFPTPGLSKNSSHYVRRQNFSTTPNPNPEDPKKSKEEEISQEETKKPSETSEDKATEESSKEKKEEPSIFESISNSFKGIGEFFSFSDSKDNKDKGDSNKSSDTKGGDNWWNDNSNLATLGLVVLAGGVVLMVRTDSFHEFVGNYRPITYVELIALIEGSEVERIRVKRITEGKDMHNKAYVVTRSGSVRVLELGNVDHFLESIEKIQVGKTSSSTGVIP